MENLSEYQLRYAMFWQKVSTSPAYVCITCDTTLSG